MSWGRVDYDLTHRKVINYQFFQKKDSLCRVFQTFFRKDLCLLKTVQVAQPQSSLSEDFLAKGDKKVAPGLQGWKEGAPPAQQERPEILSL